MAGADLALEHDKPIPLHPLVYVPDGDEVTIGRRDVDSYAVFPADGAEVVRRLETGASPGEVVRWYQAEYGESLDIDHVLAALVELDFVRDPSRPDGPSKPVRWQRLGATLFSVPAWLVYAGIAGWAVAVMIRSPDAVPTYHSIFFTDYYAVIELTLVATVIPLLLAHECFHALAARRLGVRTRLGIGRRLYTVVLETRMDGLVAVPRRQRYLPILAGVLFDGLAVAIFIVIADASRDPHGEFTLAGRLCLALAFTTFLRIVWQTYLYLRTDLYALVVTVLGCVDLHATARRLLANRWNRLLGRTHRVVDESTWHPVDRRVARWYSWLVLVGYAASIGTLILAVVPVFARLVAGLAGRLTGDQPTPAGLYVDAIVFLGLTMTQVGVSSWMAIREWRSRGQSRFQHVVA